MGIVVVFYGLVIFVFEFRVFFKECGGVFFLVFYFGEVARDLRKLYVGFGWLRFRNG